MPTNFYHWCTVKQMDHLELRELKMQACTVIFLSLPGTNITIWIFIHVLYPLQYLILLKLKMHEYSISIFLSLFLSTMANRVKCEFLSRVLGLTIGTNRDYWFVREYIDREKGRPRFRISGLWWFYRLLLGKTSLKKGPPLQSETVPLPCIYSE